LIGLTLSSGCQHLQAQRSTTEHVLHRAPRSTTEQVLHQAEACRRNQDFACAERLLAPARHPETGPADPRVIYLAGLVAVDARNPTQNYQTACECFQRLVTNHAESPQAADAEAWLGLIAEVRSQAEAIDRLKTANTSLQQENAAQQARLSRMQKRLERLKAVDLSKE
jgi:hypothetical protein